MGLPTLRHPVALRLFHGYANYPQRLDQILAAYAAHLKVLLGDLREIRHSLGDIEGFGYPALVAEWGLSYFAAELEAVTRQSSGREPADLTQLEDVCHLRGPPSTGRDTLSRTLGPNSASSGGGSDRRRQASIRPRG